MRAFIKFFKIFMINLFVFLGLIVAFEIACRFRLIPERKIVAESPVRLKTVELSPIELQKEFGPAILEKIPANMTGSYDESLNTKYSYADIDHNHQTNRKWDYSPDGQSRRSQFSKKIRGTNIELYNVNYTYNSFGKRQVDNQFNKPADHFILCAGDSFTFGEGVNQGQDYPSQLASLVSEKWRIYNYGVTGDSANDFYLRGLANPDYFAPIAEQEGDFIWLYHEVQMQRLVYPINAYETAKYIATKPEYTLSGDEIVSHGFFNESDRAMRSFYNLMAKSAITKTFNLELPRIYSEQNFRLFFALLNAGLERIPGKRFNRKIIISYFAHHDFETFKKVALEYGFDVFDFEKVLTKRDFTKDGDVHTTIPVDGHPTSESYWLLAQALNFHYYH